VCPRSVALDDDVRLGRDVADTAFAAPVDARPFRPAPAGRSVRSHAGDGPARTCVPAAPRRSFVAEATGRVAADPRIDCPTPDADGSPTRTAVHRVVVVELGVHRDLPVLRRRRDIATVRRDGVVQTGGRVLVRSQEERRPEVVGGVVHATPGHIVGVRDRRQPTEAVVLLREPVPLGVDPRALLTVTPEPVPVGPLAVRPGRRPRFDALAPAAVGVHVGRVVGVVPPDHVLVGVAVETGHPRVGCSAVLVDTHLPERHNVVQEVVPPYLPDTRLPFLDSPVGLDVSGERFLLRDERVRGVELPFRPDASPVDRFDGVPVGVVLVGRLVPPAVAERRHSLEGVVLVRLDVVLGLLG